MKLLRILVLAGFSAGFSTGAFSQTISGIVVKEADGRPLPSATVTAYQTDSSLVKATLTDASGKFVISSGSKAVSMIRISYTGLKPFEKKINISGTGVTLDTIKLQDAAHMLSAVEIRAEKPIITTKVDRIIVNVDGTILSKGNSVLDVLKKSPGVSADAASNVQLNGKNGVTILLDDKNTNLSPSDLATMLSSMSAESVQIIELMANPSSKYDAAGNGGIINIVTKKKRSNGYSMNVSASGTGGRHLREDLSLNFIQKINRISHYHSLSLSNGDYTFDFKTSRFVPLDGKAYTGSSTLFQNSRSLFYRGGVDYQISAKSTFGALFTTNIYRGKSVTGGSTSIITPGNLNEEFLTTDNNNKSRFRGFGYNLYYQTRIDTSGEMFTINLDHNNYNSAADGTIDNSGDVRPDERSVQNTSDNRININSVKADYTLPFKKKWTLETGVKTSFVNTDNGILYQNLISGDYQNDPLRTNNFNLKENINAAYGSLSTAFGKKTSVKAGLRLEQTNNKGRSAQSGKVNDNHYLNIFPTMFIDRKINDKNSINFSYGRRIDRPSYKDLNPFIYYNNPYSYYTGNPFLKPQYSDNFSLTYALKQKYFFSLNYMAVKDVFNTNPSLDTVRNVEISTPFNLDKQKLFYVNLSVPVTITNWWSVYNYVNLYYSRYRSEYLNGEFTANKPTAYIYQDQTFTLGKRTSVDLLLTYDAPQISGLYSIRQRFQANLSAQVSLFKNNSGYLKLSANDIFKGSGTNSSYNYQYLVGNTTSYYDNRYLKLTFSFNINKLTDRIETNRPRGNEEEQNRIK